MPGYLLLSFACQLVGVMLAALVWSDILRRLGVKAGYWFDLETFCVSAIARKIPGTVWYALGRLTIYNAVQMPKAPVIIALVIEMVAISLGGLIDLGFSLGKELVLPGWIDRQVLLFAVIPVLVVITSTVGPYAIRFVVRRMTNKEGQSDLPELAPITFWDALRWLSGEAVVVILSAGVVFFVLKSIDANTPVPYTSILGAVSLAVALGPIAVWMPGDIGLRDGFMYLVMSPWTSGSFAAVVTLAWRIWVSMLEILMGLLAWVVLSRRLGQNNFLNLVKGKKNDRDPSYG